MAASVSVDKPHRCVLEYTATHNITIARLQAFHTEFVKVKFISTPTSRYEERVLSLAR